jgi:redox-regulated HSP33 family molecular chaperone
MTDDDISDTIMEILSRFFRASDRVETRMSHEEYEKNAKDMKEGHVLNQVLSVNKPDAEVNWYEVHLSSNSISMDDLTSMQKELRSISVAIESVRSRPEIDEVKRTVYGPLVLTLYYDPQISVEMK